MPLKGSSFEADLVKINTAVFSKTFNGYTGPTKTFCLFFMSSEGEKRSALLHYPNHPLFPLLPPLSPPILESLMHAFTKWTARQWGLIHSNKKYKKSKKNSSKKTQLSNNFLPTGFQLSMIIKGWRMVFASIHEHAEHCDFFASTSRNKTNLLCKLASNAKIWGARASVHSFKFCEQIKQR